MFCRFLCFFLLSNFVFLLLTYAVVHFTFRIPHRFWWYRAQQYGEMRKNWIRLYKVGVQQSYGITLVFVFGENRSVFRCDNQQHSSTLICTVFGVVFFLKKKIIFEHKTDFPKEIKVTVFTAFSNINKLLCEIEHKAYHLVNLLLKLFKKKKKKQFYNPKCINTVW